METDGFPITTVGNDGDEERGPITVVGNDEKERKGDENCEVGLLYPSQEMIGVASLV